MRKSFLMFVVLFTAFFGVWIFKSKTPLNSPDVVLAADSHWWEEVTGKVTVNQDWVLDPEIPVNYIPVPGEDELYMVIDNQGNIIGYRHRTQMEDGTWVWEDVDPNIPSNYEAVPGLTNVYKVTEEDGTVHYVKYIRNDDGSFAFIDVDENGNEIDKDGNLVNANADQIPDNYKRISGNVYAVYDENGVLLGFKKRIKNEDGSYRWENTGEPEPEPTKDVAAIMQTEPAVVQAENGEQSGGGNGFQGFVFNVPGGGGGTPSVNLNIGNGGSYVVPNGGTVSIPINNGGGYYYYPHGSDGGYYTQNGAGNPVAMDGSIMLDDGNTTVPNDDGTYTETEQLITTEDAGGWRITYQTNVMRTYDANGTLLTTKKEGPFEIAREQVIVEQAGPDRTQIAGSLGAELARVSASVAYDDGLANEILAQLNAERVAAGLPALSMNGGSVAYQAARLYAADMATYNHADYSSPMYGNLNNMLSMFGYSYAAPTLNIWRTTPTTAAQIHSKFQVVDGSRAARMSPSYTNVGIAVASRNGYYYIVEVFLN